MALAPAGSRSLPHHAGLALELIEIEVDPIALSFGLVAFHESRLHDGFSSDNTSDSMGVELAVLSVSEQLCRIAWTRTRCPGPSSVSLEN